MAHPAQQEGIKEMIQSIREVVPDRSNNEIHMVLQFYDFNVDAATAAYLENGAVDALSDWHHMGNVKTVSKKKKKKSKLQQPVEAETATTATLLSTTVCPPESHHGTEIERKDTGDKLEDSQLAVTIKGNSLGNDTACKDAPLMLNGHEGVSRSSTAQPRLPDVITTMLSQSQSSALPAAHKIVAAEVSASQPKLSAGSLPSESISSASSLSMEQRRVRKESTSLSATSPPLITPTSVNAAGRGSAMPTNGHVTMRNGSEEITHRREKVQATVAPPAAAISTRTERPAKPLAGAGQHHAVRPDHARSTNSIAAGTTPLHALASHHGAASGSITQLSGAVSKPRAGLEKSTKDLHRQSISLARLQLVFHEECERSSKKIKIVFDELRHELNEREADLMYQMDKMKEDGDGTFIQRLNKAAELKVRCDRCPISSSTAAGSIEHQLDELRADIKHFVSERKMDDELGCTVRFVYGNSDILLERIKTLGEVIPIKSGYAALRRHSSSSACSSAPSIGDGEAARVTSKQSYQPRCKASTTVASAAPSKEAVITSSENASKGSSSAAMVSSSMKASPAMSESKENSGQSALALPASTTGNSTAHLRDLNVHSSQARPAFVSATEEVAHVHRSPQLASPTTLSSTKDVPLESAEQATSDRRPEQQRQQLQGQQTAQQRQQRTPQMQQWRHQQQTPHQLQQMPQQQPTLRQQQTSRQHQQAPLAQAVQHASDASKDHEANGGGRQWNSNRTVRRSAPRPESSWQAEASSQMTTPRSQDADLQAPDRAAAQRPHVQHAEAPGHANAQRAHYKQAGDGAFTQQHVTAAKRSSPMENGQHRTPLATDARAPSALSEASSSQQAVAAATPHRNSLPDAGGKTGGGLERSSTAHRGASGHSAVSAASTLQERHYDAEDRSASNSVSHPRQKRRTSNDGFESEKHSTAAGRGRQSREWYQQRGRSNEPRPKYLGSSGRLAEEDSSQDSSSKSGGIDSMSTAPAYYGSSSAKTSKRIYRGSPARHTNGGSVGSSEPHADGAVTSNAEPVDNSAAGSSTRPVDKRPAGHSDGSVAGPLVEATSHGVCGTSDMSVDVLSATLSAIGDDSGSGRSIKTSLVARMVEDAPTIRSVEHVTGVQSLTGDEHVSTRADTISFIAGMDDLPLPQREPRQRICHKSCVDSVDLQAAHSVDLQAAPLPINSINYSEERVTNGGGQSS